MKKCSRCGQWKHISEFHKTKNGKYGVRSICKECANKYTKEYYESNTEYYKEYYENNKDCKKKYAKEYRENVTNYKRQKIGISLRKHKKQGYDVLVTTDECMGMDNDHCFYCGCRLEWEYGTGFTNCSPTIDRKENENTLTKDNIVFACRSCNGIKGDGTTKEMIERCKRVVANENNILGDN